MKFLDLLATESGRVVARYYQTDVSVESKADATPVTVADRLAEEKLRALIGREFPDHGVIGEEFGETNADAEYVWIVDPIDGTKSFVAGVPLFGTLIGLLRGGEPLVGVIANPILGFTLCGDNRRALCNGRPASCRPCDSLSEAVLSTTSPLSSARHPQGKNFTRLTEQVKLYRGWGDCYGYYLLATGRVDIMLDPAMKPWDILPLIPVIRGAGGVITTWRGDDPVKDPTSAAASGPGVHDAVIGLLNA
ncbi:MAG: histidinol-phosphatase [Spirochaetales bacterium]|nr:histidinol-phosphatase [Spirochaetales bacterium]